MVLHHFTDKNYIVLKGNGVKRMPSVSLLFRHMQDICPAAAEVFSSAVYLTGNVLSCMDERTYTVRCDIDITALDTGKLYAADLSLADMAIESAIALEDMPEGELTEEIKEECVSDILKYADSLVPYADYIKKGNPYGKDAEYLYTGIIRSFRLQRWKDKGKKKWQKKPKM